MENLPQDWFALIVLAALLGARHGFDADHLATIDGLTRFNARTNPHFARWCGTLFSLGHGAVVLVIALGVSTLAQGWNVPEWLELSGAWISIGFLIALGVLNLHGVLRTAPGQIVVPVGLKGRLLGRWMEARSPVLVACVGALFALSFDTVSQAALFAVAGSQFGGWGHALALGLCFTFGMLAADGINGLWISRLIQRADQTAQVASRVMGLAVSGVSILVGVFGLLKLVSPSVDAWSDGKELTFGMALVGVMALSFLGGMRLTRVPLAVQRV